MIRSNVWCTNCSQQFLSELDLGLNGNHEIRCPYCRHIHYRVVRDGVVTEDRYRSSAGPTYQVVTFTITNASFNYNLNAMTDLWTSRSDLNLIPIRSTTT